MTAALCMLIHEKIVRHSWTDRQKRGQRRAKQICTQIKVTNCVEIVVNCVGSANNCEQTANYREQTANYREQTAVANDGKATKVDVITTKANITLANNDVIISEKDVKTTKIRSIFLFKKKFRFKSKVSNNLGFPLSFTFR